jgi:predicted nuclease with TOPRIM domain
MDEIGEAVCYCGLSTFDDVPEVRALRAEVERLKSDWQLAVKIAEQHALEVERLRAILKVVADCLENDDVAFGQHLCVEQVRVEVARGMAGS